MRPIPAFLLVALAIGGGAVAARDTVQDIRDLLVAAIDSAGGEASGVLGGDAAQAITRHFGAGSPIRVHVVTERRHAQPGCSRLKVAFTQDGVLLPGAAPRQQSIVFGLDYCRDGEPPRSVP